MRLIVDGMCLFGMFQCHRQRIVYSWNSVSITLCLGTKAYSALIICLVEATSTFIFELHPSFDSRLATKGLPLKFLHAIPLKRSRGWVQRVFWQPLSIEYKPNEYILVGKKTCQEEVWSWPPMPLAVQNLEYILLARSWFKTFSDDLIKLSNKIQFKSD